MTDLQRDILITARNNPRASQKQIADMCGCSSSYVSNVLNRYDSVDAFNAEMESMAGIEPMQPALDMRPPAWLEQSEPIANDEELDQAVEEGMMILGQSLKKGYKGLKTLVRKISN
ncbi:winged helix-turn-helix domain-containing protein [Halomicroarcula sp. GCM10025817]|uniref:winged helix-turn-helix domain-containing protein n=1 Tax=Halomicroarcula sp. GCM10025817 TaxID=3252672 RepID=UPI003610EF90